MRRPRRILGRISFLLGSVLVALLIGELALRGIGYAGDQERLESVFDPLLGTVKKDSWALSFSVEEQDGPTVEVGGQSVSIEKDHAKRRFLFVGDSGTEGARVAPEEAFPARFGELLDAEHPGHEVEVINAGVWGMSTIDEYHFLEERLLPLRPDVVVLGLFMSNDINFNLGHGERRIQLGLLQRALKLLRERSALVHFVYLRTQMLNSRYGLFTADTPEESSLVPLELRLIDSRGFSMLNYPIGETATYQKEPTALVNHAFEVLDRVLLDFLELGAEHGFELWVLVIPSPSAVMGRLTLLHYPRKPYRFLARSGIDIKPAELDFSLPRRRVAEMCRERQIVCIDPTEAMKKLRLKAFFPGDEHNTASGHLVLARALVDFWESSH